MDATRVEVERELKRMRGSVESVRFRIKQRKQDIESLIERNYNAATIANKAEWLRQDEQEERLYMYAERTLQGILDRSKEPTAVEGDSQP